MGDLLEAFPEVWAADFEFWSAPGERPVPVCLVAWELRAGRKLRLWREDFGARPPYSIGSDSLFIAYFASAELGCHLSLGWDMPGRILDLFTEFRCLTNGEETPAGNSLLGALTYYALDNIGATEKEEMRSLVLRGGPWTCQEQEAILSYCELDVAALAQLLPRMLPRIDLPRALFRGRYMAAVAAMEFVGVPIDTELLERLRTNWTSIQEHLITAIDADYHLYDDRTFKLERFERWLVTQGIAWPLLESGQLDLSRSTFREMAKIHPAISPLHELRHALSEMRLNELAVGKDGHNRCMLSPFRARTSRNCPSNTRFIFGPSVWLRSLIKPPPGWGLAYLDWVQQEFGIAAALSGDPKMMAAYQSGDSYLGFAKQAGAVPQEATKQTHGLVRDQFKQCVLGCPIRHRRGGSGGSHRPGANPCPPAFKASPRALQPVLALERSHPGSRHAPTAGKALSSAGNTKSLAILTPAQFATFICKPTAPKCCDWPAAWVPKTRSKSARSSTVRRTDGTYRYYAWNVPTFDGNGSPGIARQGLVRQQKDRGPVQLRPIARCCPYCVFPPITPDFYDLSDNIGC